MRFRGRRMGKTWRNRGREGLRGRHVKRERRHLVEGEG